MTSMYSAARAPRPFMTAPAAVNSSGIQPRPSPSSSRPPDSTSTEAACLIRLGVAGVNMPYLAPAYLAKQAASLDVLSGGRLDLGLGLGWRPEAFPARRPGTTARG